MNTHGRLQRLISTTLMISLLLLSLTAYLQTSVTTQHNDLDRTGWNNRETILNTKNVKAGTFGKLYERPVDDNIYAQLLVMQNVNLPGVGKRNIVIAATVNNSVYAYDADSMNLTDPYWKVNLTPAGQRPVKNIDMTTACNGNYRDFLGNIGIVGTPVIDTTSGTIYLVTRSCTTDGTQFFQYIHALDVETGQERTNSPKVISGSVNGSGSGNVGGVITFDAHKQNQRCGLLLLNNIIYVCYASHCDWGPYHGWIFGYNKKTLDQAIVYNATTKGYNGGIWMSGAAPAADEAGNLYVASGNGSAGYRGDMNDVANRSESALKLTPQGSTLSVSSFFTPMNYTDLEYGDLDFGSTVMMLIPNTNRAITGVKDGSIYLMDRDNLGGYNASSNNVVQHINLGTNAHLRTTFAYYKGTKTEFIYTWSENSLLKAFPYDRTAGTLKADNVISSGVQGPTGNSGAFLSVSSNGSIDSTAILWATFAETGDANQSVRPGVLHAFDASSITKELWNSSIDSTDNPGSYAKFNCPTIANGKVYLATFSNKFIVYGLKATGASNDCSINVALNKPAIASSSESSSNSPDKAFDALTTTHWSTTDISGPQYIYVNLGDRYDLCHLILKWETAFAKDFTIDVSEDAKSWTTIASRTKNTSSMQYISLQGSGRYIRMNATAAATNSGYSINEFEVYGKVSQSDCAMPDNLSTSDIYEGAARLMWNGNGASFFKIQYKPVTSSDWKTVSSDTSAVTVTDLACGTDYLFRIEGFCSGSDSSGYSASAPFSSLACGSGCNPLPTRWTTQDIGNTSIIGSACLDSTTFILTGSGADIGGTSDAFRFAYQTLAGDGEFNAKVRELDQVNASNKCGIMIRETLSAGSKFAFIALTSGNGANFETRSATNGTANNLKTGTDIAAPYWIKLIKTGSVYTALVSKDGIVYTQVGDPVDAGFGSTDAVYAGLAMTSHDDTKLSTGAVDNYSFTSGVLPLKLINFSASLNLSRKVELKWMANRESNIRWFVLERSSSDYRFKSLDTIRAAITGGFTTAYKYTDQQPFKDINFYRLGMIDQEDNMSYSPLLYVRLALQTIPTIYPNPARANINISAGSEPIKSITVYTVTGIAVMNLDNVGNNQLIQIPVSNLANGTYFFRLKTSSNTYNEKVIIR